MKQSMSILTIIIFSLLVSSRAFAGTNAVKATNLDQKSLLLLTTTQSGDTEIVGELIAKKINIEAKDDYGRTALHVAAEHGQAEVATMLIEAGADIEARTNTALRVYWQSTPLMIASHWGHTEVAELLIDAGADVNAIENTSHSGHWTSLHIAADKGYIGIAKLLIANNANLEAKLADTRDTPLFHAAREKHRAIAELLIDKGAKVNAVNASASMPLPTKATYRLPSCFWRKGLTSMRPIRLYAAPPSRGSAQSGHGQAAY